MQITTTEGIKDIYVQTVTIQPQVITKLYGFHCVNCGQVIPNKIGGKVSKIYPVYEPSEQTPIITRCKKCFREYAFQTYDGYSKEQVKVILHAIPTNEMNTNQFYCWRGKDLLLDFTSSSIYSYVEKQYKTIPFVSKCSKLDCDVTYLFSDIF